VKLSLTRTGRSEAACESSVFFKHIDAVTGEVGDIKAILIQVKGHRSFQTIPDAADKRSGLIEIRTSAIRPDLLKGGTELIDARRVEAQNKNILAFICLNIDGRIRALFGTNPTIETIGPGLALAGESMLDQVQAILDHQIGAGGFKQGLPLLKGAFVVAREIVRITEKASRKMKVGFYIKRTVEILACGDKVTGVIMIEAFFKVFRGLLLL